LTVRRDLHLLPEPHIMLNVLARHPDIVGDLVDFVALRGVCQDAGAAKTMDGGMVCFVGLNIPFVFLDLGSDPFLPAAASFLLPRDGIFRLRSRGKTAEAAPMC
jgi:hypothetical protein